MTYYRLYFLDSFDGRIREFREFEAEGDLAAVAQANDWRGVGPMELWSHQRKVKCWDGIPARRPPASDAGLQAL